MEWKRKLEKFLESWPYIEDTVGILACGSYITGNPTSHSDLDVHIVLKESVGFRIKGTKIVENLLIEFFCNTPDQIRAYFRTDYEDMSLMCQTQFATGEIYLDKTGIMKELKLLASEAISQGFEFKEVNLHPLALAGLWDCLDDLEDILENKRADFDFIYYNNLDTLLETYMHIKKYPYNIKSILGHLTSDITRNKYLLKEFKDQEDKELIIRSITAPQKEDRLNCYRTLTNKIFDLCGGFQIDGFSYQSPKEI